MTKVKETVSVLRQNAFDFFCEVRKIYADYLLDLPLASSLKLRSVLILFDTYSNGQDVRNRYYAASFHEFLAFIYDYVAWEFDNRADYNDYNTIWEPDDMYLNAAHLSQEFVSTALSIADQVAEFLSDTVTSSLTVEEIADEWYMTSWCPDFPFVTVATDIKFRIEK